MSHDTNVNVLETAAELIDRLEGTKSVERLISAVESGDLEEVYYQNMALMKAYAHDIVRYEP